MDFDNVKIDYVIWPGGVPFFQMSSKAVIIYKIDIQSKSRVTEDEKRVFIGIQLGSKKIRTQEL